MPLTKEQARSLLLQNYASPMSVLEKAETDSLAVAYGFNPKDFDVISPSSGSSSFSNEMKALAQGAIRGATLGIVDTPDALKPDEEKLWKPDIPFLGPSSISRGVGEAAASMLPYGFAGKIGRLFMGSVGKNVIGGAVGKAIGTGALQGTKLAAKVSGSWLEREIGGAIIGSAGDIGRQAVEIKEGKRQDFDLNQVAEGAVFGVVVGLGMEAGIRGATKGVEFWKKRFNALPKPIVQRASDDIMSRIPKPEDFAERNIFGGSVGLPDTRNPFLVPGGPEVPMTSLAPGTGTLNAEQKVSGLTARGRTATERILSPAASPDLQDIVSNQASAKAHLKRMDEVREAGLLAAKKLRMDASDVFQHAQVWAGPGKEVTVNDVHRAQAWIETQRKNDVAFGSSDVRITTNVKDIEGARASAEAQLRGMTPEQMAEQDIYTKARQRNYPGSEWISKLDDPLPYIDDPGRPGSPLTSGDPLNLRGPVSPRPEYSGTPNQPPPRGNAPHIPVGKPYTEIEMREAARRRITVDELRRERELVNPVEVVRSQNQVEQSYNRQLDESGGRSPLLDDLLGPSTPSSSGGGRALGGSPLRIGEGAPPKNPATIHSPYFPVEEYGGVSIEEFHNSVFSGPGGRGGHNDVVGFIKDNRHVESSVLADHIRDFIGVDRRQAKSIIENIRNEEYASAVKAVQNPEDKIRILGSVLKSEGIPPDVYAKKGLKDQVDTLLKFKILSSKDVYTKGLDFPGGYVTLKEKPVYKSPHTGRETRIIDPKTGKQAKLYHGTRSQFEVFDFGLDRFEKANFKDVFIPFDQLAGVHFGFKDLADVFALATKKGIKRVEGVPRTLSVWLAMKNPRVIKPNKVKGIVGEANNESDAEAIAGDVLEELFDKRVGQTKEEAAYIKHIFEKWYVSMVYTPGNTVSELKKLASETFERLSKAKKLSQFISQDAGDYQMFGGVPGIVTNEDRFELIEIYRKSLDMQGHDGIIYRNTNIKETRGIKDPTSFIAFKPETVVKATKDAVFSMLPLLPGAIGAYYLKGRFAPEKSDA